MEKKLKVEESNPRSLASPSSSVPATSHITTGAQVLRLPARYFSRRFRTPQGAPICDQALAPAKAWALIAADGLVRWCTRCKRFRAEMCARRGPLPS